MTVRWQIDPTVGRPRKDISDCKVARVQVLFTPDEYKDFKRIVEEFQLTESKAGSAIIQEWISLYDEQEGR